MRLGSDGAARAVAAREGELGRCLKRLATPGGLEPPAYGLGNRRSILLSYGVADFLDISFHTRSPLLWRELSGGMTLPNSASTIVTIAL